MVSLATEGCETLRSKIQSCHRPYSRCYQPVLVFKYFPHQDFSTIPVDLQEWNWGSWGCGGRGRMGTESLTLWRPWREMGYKGWLVFVQKIVVYWIHRPREWDVYNLITTFSLVPLCGKHSFSEYPSLSSVPCLCMSAPLGYWIIELSKRRAMKFHEFLIKMKFCKSKPIRQTSSPFNKNAWSGN